MDVNLSSSLVGDWRNACIFDFSGEGTAKNASAERTKEIKTTGKTSMITIILVAVTRTKTS